MAEAPEPEGRRLHALYLLFLAFVVCSALGNQLLDRVNLTHKVWAYNVTVPPMLPLGSDLRVFVEASDKMYHGENPLWWNYSSPPLTAVVFFPFILMSYGTAYWVMFFLIIAGNVACLLLLGWLASRAFGAPARRGEKPDHQLGAALAGTFLIIGMNQFFGYPLEFSLERANYDSFALLAALAGLWLSARFPNGRWLQVLTFSFAAHLKVYPALLLFLPIWKHGRRALLPIFATNVLMFFSFGLDRGVEFLTGLYAYSTHPYLWQGNHSAASFGSLVLEPKLASIFPGLPVHYASIALLVMPVLALWAWGTWKLHRAGYSERTVLFATALAMPVMCVLPSVSHDYRLIIMMVPAFLCVLHFSHAYLRTGRGRFFIGLAATLYCLLTLGRSIQQPPLMLTINKYPAVLVLTALTFWVTWREAERKDTVTQAVENRVV